MNIFTILSHTTTAITKLPKHDISITSCKNNNTEGLNNDDAES
ncbi:7507_t:CDS:1, partial [Gigaspora margarita]